MDRRTFFKSIVGGLVIAATPIKFVVAKARSIYDDFFVSATGDIRWVGESENTYTVIELHRFLMDQADDEPFKDTPSDRSTENW